MPEPTMPAPAYGFVSHAEWSPSQPFVTYAEQQPGCAELQLAIQQTSANKSSSPRAGVGPAEEEAVETRASADYARTEALADHHAADTTEASAMDVHGDAMQTKPLGHKLKAGAEEGMDLDLLSEHLN